MMTVWSCPPPPRALHAIFCTCICTYKAPSPSACCWAAASVRSYTLIGIAHFGRHLRIQELHYFDSPRFSKGLAFYDSHFCYPVPRHARRFSDEPTKVEKELVRLPCPEPLPQGLHALDCSPTMLGHISDEGTAPARVHETYQPASRPPRFVVVIRPSFERATSHWAQVST